MKIKRNIRTLVISASIVVGAMFFVSAQKPDFKIGRNIEMLINMYRDISVLYVDETDPDVLLKDAARGLVYSLDPYTEFMPEEDMEDFEFMTTGKYGGIGSLIREKDDWVYIAQPYQGFPADKVGLKIGDKILAIDGVSAEKIGTAAVSSKMKGDPGTTFTLKVEKVYSGEVKEIEVTRERIVISGIPYYGFVDQGIGYIQHNDFTEDCSDDMRKAYMELRKEGNLKGLILDYRNNGGGILQEAVKILSLFVPKGTEVVSMRGRLPEMTTIYKTETEPIDLEIPIVVLVNGSSASAAEIVSGALQDLDRAVLIGQRTFGKGLVQSTKPVGYNSYLKLTTAKYFMPSGRCIQAIDYAHSKKDGSAGEVPDSLIQEFKTKNGRKVYDGEGIMPDIETTPSYLSRFTLIALAKGYIEDFAELYVGKHQDASTIKLGEFKLSDEDYSDFEKFMEDKDVEYKSQTAATLELLEQRATRELYLDHIEEHIEAIRNSLKDDKASSLTLYREQLSKLIEDNIILRHYYAEGVSKHSLEEDELIEQAIELFGDSERYQKIITSQDTSRGAKSSELQADDEEL